MSNYIISAMPANVQTISKQQRKGHQGNWLLSDFCLMREANIDYSQLSEKQNHKVNSKISYSE